MDKPDPLFWSQLLHDVVDLVTPTANDIFTSPAKLGSLLRIVRALEPIGQQAEHAAIDLAFHKHEIPGFSLVRRDGSKYVEPNTIITLLESLTMREFFEVLPAVLSWCGSVSERRYLTLCELTHRTASSAAICRSGATVFLRLNPTETKKE